MYLQNTIYKLWWREGVLLLFYLVVWLDWLTDIQFVCSCLTRSVNLCRKQVSPISFIVSGSPCPSLTHWGRVTYICIGKLIIIGSDNGLSPDRRQAIIWTNAESLSIGPLRTYFSENLIKMQHFSLKKMHVNMSSAKWRLCCLGLNVLTHCGLVMPHGDIELGKPWLV